MAITKCRIWVPPVNLFTVRRDVLRQCGLASDEGWLGRRKIMSKTNATDTAARSEHELTENDLALVSGGKPSAAPKVSESLSLSYEQVKFEYTEQR
jgi:hypothetical protein